MMFIYSLHFLLIDLNVAKLACTKILYTWPVITEDGKIHVKVLNFSLTCKLVYRDILFFQRNVNLLIYILQHTCNTIISSTHSLDLWFNIMWLLMFSIMNNLITKSEVHYCIYVIYVNIYICSRRRENYGQTII